METGEIERWTDVDRNGDRKTELEEDRNKSEAEGEAERESQRPKHAETETETERKSETDKEAETCRSKKQTSIEQESNTMQNKRCVNTVIVS